MAQTVRLTDLPVTILEDVFLELNLADLAACRRVCKTFNNCITTSATVKLHFELLAASLSAPIKVRKSTSASGLLSTLREHQTRFRNLTPSKSYSVDLESDEGRLYEYLEGVLLRGNGLPANRTSRLPSGTTLYDFTASSEWETVEEGEETLSQSAGQSGQQTFVSNTEQPEVVLSSHEDAREEYHRRKWASPFEVKDITMDPGQDLFVAAQQVSDARDISRPWKLHLHFLTLSNFEPHPLALPGGKIEASLELPTRVISLILQVCDDYIFVFAARISEFRIPESVTETSRTSFATRETGLQTLEDFLLLSSDMFCCAAYISAPDVADGELVCTLNFYSFEPLEDPGDSSTVDRRKPSHCVRLLARLSLPAFQLVCNVSLRADPAPRAYFPVSKPLPLYPKPDTGLIVISFDCADGHPVAPHQPTFYTLLVLRQSLLGLITPEMREGARTSGYHPALLPFSSIAPYCRFRSTDEQQGWVCYVYHYRYITGQPTSEHSGMKYISVHDFDPLRAKREVSRRKRKVLEQQSSAKRKLDNPDGVANSAISVTQSVPGEYPNTRAAAASEREKEIYLDEDGFDLLQLDGPDEDGIYLHIREEFVDKNEDQHVKESVRTGHKMPYIEVQDRHPRLCHGLMIDDSRIVTITERMFGGNPVRLLSPARLEVLEMS